MDKYIGKRLDGRYEIRELIGVGGMANVYKAYDVLEKRIVAVKILREEYMDNDEFMRRFRNESRAISLLDHPNIVKVYDVIFSNRIQSIVMEYIDGITLKDYIDQEHVLRWKEAVHFTVQILKALQHAHDKGIIHRDIKPHNIMLLSDGTIKITDFGIARFSRSNTKTITDKAIGSVHYISPEQASGAFTDARSDIYSLGVMMFEMLTGKLPFEADSLVSVAIKQIQSQPTLPRSINPDIPEGLQDIVMRAMQKDAAKRYQSAAEMLHDIDEFKKNPSIVFAYKYEQPVQTHIQQELRHNQEEQRGLDREQRPMKRERPSSKKKTEADYEERKPLPLIPVMAGIAFAFLLAAGAFIGMLFLVNKPFEQVANVKVPDLVGMNYESIKTKYSDQFKIEIEEKAPSSLYEEGEIYDQNPDPGRTVKEHSTITIKVSTGKETIVLDDYAGKDSTEVFRDLSSKNLTWTETETYSNEYPAGTVVMTAPGAGEEVGEGDEISVYVSLGSQEQNQTVPLVVGMNFHEAKTLLSTRRLRIECVEEVQPQTDEDGKTVAGQVAAGTILEQSPNEDALVPAGTVINVKVMGGEGWEDPNKPRQVEISFDLPEGDGKVHVQTYVDGKETGYGDPDLSKQSTWTTKPTGKGDSKVEIYIDGELYLTYDVNFDTGVVVPTTDLQAVGEYLNNRDSQEDSTANEDDDEYAQPSDE